MDVQENDTSICISVNYKTAAEFIEGVFITDENMLHNVIHSMIRETLHRGANKSTIVVSLSLVIDELLKMECREIQGDKRSQIFGGQVKFIVDKNNIGFWIMVVGTKEK